MQGTTHIRAGLACSLTCIVALGTAAPAFATSVAIQSNALRITDSAAEINALEVRTSPESYDVFDDNAVLTAGAGCVAVDEHHVVCAPATIQKLAIDAGGGDDIVLMGGLPVPVAAVGGDGDDLIEGGDGGDLLVGGLGNDAVHGGPGDDTIIGTGGDDLLEGDTGSDRLAGGDDADIVMGEAGSGDVLNGNDGPDLLRGGSGDDTLNGGAGADALVTGTGVDKANPGAGRDRIFGTSTDTLTCNAGDQVSARSAPSASNCGRLPGSVDPPQIWPPPPGSATSASAGAPLTPVAAQPFGIRAAGLGVPLPTGSYRGDVLHHGNARTLGVRIPSIYNMPVRVRVRTYNSQGAPVDRYLVNTTTKNPVRIRIRSGAEVVWSASVRCCPG